MSNAYIKISRILSHKPDSTVTGGGRGCSRSCDSLGCALNTSLSMMGICGNPGQHRGAWDAASEHPSCYPDTRDADCEHLLQDSGNHRWQLRGQPGWPCPCSVSSRGRVRLVGVTRGEVVLLHQQAVSTRTTREKFPERSRPSCWAPPPPHPPVSQLNDLAPGRRNISPVSQWPTQKCPPPWEFPNGQLTRERKATPSASVS
jgi:hypothetical protein